MNRFIVYGLAAVAILLVLVAGASLTGLVTVFPNDHGLVIGDDVTVKGSDLVTCCTFTVDGEEKTCSVLAAYACDYCTPYCAR